VKLTVKRKDILSALDRCAATDQKATVGAAFAGMVQITANLAHTGESAQLFATDLTLSVDTAIVAKVEGAGSTGVNAKRLAAVIGTFVEGDVELQVDGTQLKVSGPGQRRYSLPTIAANEFPTAPETMSNMPSFMVAADTLRSLIAAVKHAMPTDDDKPFLHGVRLEGTKDGVLESVATDGHRLATMKTTVDPPVELEGMIPRSMVKLVETLCANEKRLTLISDEKRVYIETPDTLVSSLVAEGLYPPWRDLLAGAEGKCIGKVAPADLTAAIKGVLAASDAKDAAVRICLAEPFDALQVHLETKTTPTRAVDQVPLDSEEEEALETWYDPRYLLDAAAAAPSDIKLTLLDDVVPGLMFKCDEGYIAWPMPMRRPGG
jgi:DNA polymerase-3 subunit beta